MGEFELIRRFFAPAAGHRPDVALGIGDDAAVLRVPAGVELAVTTDTLVAGIHFPPDTAPDAIGHKSLAVSLSDLAAMGAEPAWATLALTVPGVDATWLAAFARGLSALASAHGVALVGGDTTRGPLSITMQALGFLPAGRALRRSGARPGDDLYVTGTLGDAGLALAGLQGRRIVPEDALQALRRRLDTPQPRVAEGLALRDLAVAAIDVSDGLLGDVGHLARASGVGVTIQVDGLPVSDLYRVHMGAECPWDLALTAGDDYELCFAAPAAQAHAVAERFAALRTSVTRIGSVYSGSGVRCQRRDGSAYTPGGTGYDHFAGPVS
ncbi:MAG: thiamine-phosphate kinase [Chromatiales bacterium 21-64-14]|nr:MAG: thiamine-phosphate kinase [Chromatiales bacterium 21-64-14]